ncbi:hypothetical protein NE237_001713 [Protea cynaroides]|uniref:Uncharacterized protein n=1 Tax=Protea cynaroides TaxID=273540 RepID=A0A9Q0KTV6_9MAGN|nr:hypothetical protein NE237_001713 [Protea cynaroides]
MRDLEGLDSPNFRDSSFSVLNLQKLCNPSLRSLLGWRSGHVAISRQLAKAAPKLVKVSPASVGGASPPIIEPEVGSGENHDVGVGARTPWTEVVDSEEEGDSGDSKDSVLPDKGGTVSLSLWKQFHYIYISLALELSRNEARELIPMQVALNDNISIGIGNALMLHTVSDSGSVSTSNHGCVAMVNH